jgi:hypothetical protein
MNGRMSRLGSSNGARYAADLAMTAVAIAKYLPGRLFRKGNRVLKTPEGIERRG